MTQSKQIATFRDSLLPYTLAYVVQESPFYRESLGQLYQKVKTSHDLSLLPIVDKHTIQDNLNAILCNPQPNDTLTYTSGSTGKPFTVRRTADETAATQELIKRLLRGSKPGVKLPLALQIINPGHGIPGGEPDSNIIRIAEPKIPAHYRLIEELLSSSFDYNPHVEARISVLQAFFRTMLEMTFYFLQQEIDPRRFQVKRLAISGYYVSNRWRNFLENCWNAKVVDCYSLSEIPSGTFPCQKCGYHHYTYPTVIPEVVDLETKEPIECGNGALLLTALYPFSQRQPFIRYWTGDLVERGPACDRDEIGFRVRGRIKECLTMHEGNQQKLLISALDLYDLLDELPDVKIFTPRPHPVLNPNLAAAIDFQIAAGFSLDKAASGKHQLTLEVGLAYPPELYPDRIVDLRKYITTQLPLKNDFLVKLLNEAALELNVQFKPPYDLPPVLLRKAD
jgi:hypothetical protein